MAIVKQGNALTTLLIQPGAKFQNDGYGLWTGTINYKVDKAGSSAALYRGAPCPISAFSFCKMHKSAVSIGELELDTWTADFVGIDPSYGGGVRTDPQITGSQGLSSENITAHPNFFVLATGFSGTPIAGVGIGGTLAAPNYATKTLSNAPTEYEGNRGSRFQEPTGNKFLGFKVPEYSGFYGKTNYLAPQTSFSGHFYTSSSSSVTGMRDRVGKTSGTNTFNGIDVIPSYVGTTFVNGTKNQMLLAQVSFEDFGLLYKVSYEVRYNREGYEPSVYAPQ
jgi:hypothetical protein